MDKIEKTLKNLDRKPALYFENSKKLLPLTVFLENHDYTKSAENSWMFWNEGRIDTQHFDSIKKVETISDLGIFLKVFNKCYQKDDPQNPYGELGEYLKVAKKVWKRHNNTNRLEYFLVYKGLEPVAVSTLTNYGGIGYISNVGSLRSVRGEGFGKAATLYCVQHSIKRKNKECCLATEEGEYPNSFYKRIGFPTRFTATVYTKQ